MVSESIVITFLLTHFIALKAKGDLLRCFSPSIEGERSVKGRGRGELKSRRQSNCAFFNHTVRLPSFLMNRDLLNLC